MNKKTKIIIGGIGGVGGYFGGLLAKQFEGSNDVDIYFVARGEHLRQIQRNGLKVVKGDIDFIARPKAATDNVTEIGPADLIIVCTKSYDLEAFIDQLKPAVGKDTFILPLLNGVDSMETIKNILLRANVLQGCVYVISYIKEAGVVENKGNIEKLYFGDDVITGKLQLFEKIFKQAGVQAVLSENISALVWEKFYFVGANSTATSYFDCTTVEILSDKTKAEFLFSLVQEVHKVALAKGILAGKDIIQSTLQKLRAIPAGITSSMHKDFKKDNGKTELETITGYMVCAGKELNIKTPFFEIAYNELKRKQIPV